MSDFNGFGTELFTFLGELTVNNDRDWFHARKQRYEDEVRGPARAFIREMAPRIAKISGHLTASDQLVGGALMRIHRDVRFSKDKSPYKTNVGIQFRHEAGKDVHAPGLYLHLACEECFVGVGMWHPDAPSLKALRDRIVEDPEGWKKVTRSRTFRKSYRLGGDQLSRAPRGYDKDHPLIDDLKRKDFIAIFELAPQDTLGPDFPERLEKHFRAARPFLGYLSQAVGLPF